MNLPKNLKNYLAFTFQPALIGITVAILIILIVPEISFNNRKVSVIEIEKLVNDKVQEKLSEHMSYSNAVAAAAPSVVNIYSLNDSNNRTLKTSLGSGVIMQTNGIIVTNFHVIKDALKIKVLLHDGRESPADVIGWDEEIDLAILQINLNSLTAIRSGDPSKASVGDIVLAIGNPRGIGQAVTQGIISAIGINGLRLNVLENFIQTDAAINEGSSGGALVDLTGKLIGINTASLNGNGASGIGFAIPVDEVVKVTSDIIKYGRVIRGWLGIGADLVTITRSKRTEVGSNLGFIISEIISDSPAAKAGLQTGDIILSIDGNPIINPEQSISQIINVAPGQPVLLKILSGDNITQLTVYSGDRALKR